MTKVIFSLMFLIAATEARSAVVASINFLNDCTGAPSAVYNGAPTRLELRVEGLDPGSNFTADIDVTSFGNNRPYWPQHDSLRQKADESGHLIWRRGFSVNTDESGDFDRGYASRVWQATVHWSQGANSGVANNRIYLAKDENQHFFDIRSPVGTQPVCMWRKPVEILSRYYYNADVAQLTVSQEVPAANLPSLLGVDIGAQANGALTDQNAALFPHRAPYGGWVFADFEQAFGLVSPFTAEIEKSLPQGSGGFFTRRTVYSRYEVSDHVSKWTGVWFSSCRNWLKNSGGFMDIPSVVYEFSFIPQDVAGDMAKVTALIEAEARPNSDCSLQHNIVSGNEASRVEGVDPLWALYYYPQ